MTISVSSSKTTTNLLSSPFIGPKRHRGWPGEGEGEAKAELLLVKWAPGVNNLTISTWPQSPCKTANSANENKDQTNTFSLYFYREEWNVSDPGCVLGPCPFPDPECNGSTPGPTGGLCPSKRQADGLRPNNDGVKKSLWEGLRLLSWSKGLCLIGLPAKLLKRSLKFPLLNIGIFPQRILHG